MDKNLQKKTSDNPNIPQEPTHKFQQNQFNLNNQQLQQQQQQKQQQQQQFIQFTQQQKQPNIIQLNNNHSSNVSGQEEIENQIVQKVDSKEIVRELLEDVSKIKKIKHSDFVELNKYVDAFDKEESWRVAKIVQFYKDQTFTVRFDGWKDTWNEDFKFNDEKIQPVRKNTVGYTGAINSSYRMFEFANQEQNIKNAIEQMDLLNNEEFINLEASKINQWLRTELFIIGDAILSSSNIKENEYTLSIEFFDTFLRMSTRYLRILPSLIPYYIEANNIDKSLHVVNAKVALAHAFNEICDLQNEFPLKEHSRTYCVKLKEFNNKSYNLIINFMNYFGNLDGFEDAINLIKVKIETNNPNSICSRLSNLSAKEVKDLEFHETLNIIRSLQNHQIFKECESYVIKLEILEFNVLWDVIQNSSNLEKKIKAIQELNDFISRTQPNYVQNIQQKVDFIDQTIDYNKYKLSVLDKIQLQQLINEKRVIEYLLHDNFHPEIFKKSIDIINIMNDAENGFPDYYLNLLWEVSQNKHEADLRIIYEIYCQLAQNMNLSNLEFLYSKIQAIPDEKVDEITIQLLTNFSVEAMKSVSNTSEQNGFASFFTKWKKTSNSKQYEFFGLSRLYNLTQDCSKLPQQYTFLSEREKYLGFCLKNLENNISQTQSLMIAKVILKSYGRNQILQKPNTSTTESMVQKINKEKNLVDLVVNSMKKYQIDIQKNQKFQEYLLKGEEELDPKIEIFSGKINHRDNIFNRLDFLEFIFCYQKQNYQINLQQFEVLWDVLITEKAVLNYDKQMFLEWLPNINQEMEKNVIDQATKIVVDIHNRPTHDTANREVVKLQMWENFYNSCISVFQQQNFNMRAKQNIIATFKHFLIEIEGRQTINQFKNQNQIISLNVALKNDMKKQRQFNIPGDHSLLYLRKQINNEFKLKNNDFDMILPADGYIIKRDQEEEFTVVAIDNSKKP
ncbi:hypothetical protein PPERSA_04631 [Pseudocohnilembus persalinus]|uniref:UBP34/UBP24/USP9X/USP9Y-like ARM repeat region domain-containing protein n=1 Tax=Pseudocohnilembus persalinus TaxID=266149 RepID=A0A0V0QNV4_PSEPJ|nr:hypothetical protein PPERSA_04631 [Pseudocohnilembus persalinus]|eukprot:KRX03836.1 hypothetical protein PPERSA_04631 [Pseudocohnilembus persalinus]